MATRKHNFSWENSLRAHVQWLCWIPEGIYGDDWGWIISFPRCWGVVGPGCSNEHLDPFGIWCYGPRILALKTGANQHRTRGTVRNLEKWRPLRLNIRSASCNSRVKSASWTCFKWYLNSLYIYIYIYSTITPTIQFIHIMRIHLIFLYLYLISTWDY